MFLTATAVGVAVFSILLALTVLLRNTHSHYNVSFAVFAALLGVWIPANFFGSYQDTSVQLPFLFYLDFTIAPWLVFSFCIFGLESIRFYQQKSIKINQLIIWMVTGLVAFLSLGAALQLVSLPIYTPSNVLNTKEILYYPYILFAGIGVITALSTLIYSSISAKEEYKQQARYVFWGLLLGSATIISANILFPEIRLAQTLSYFAALIMLSSIGYSIVRHKLFDIRLILARSVAYILLLGVFGIGFALLTLSLSSIFFNDQNVPVGIKITYLVLALLIAILFQPLKRFFDKLSNSVFYRDAYDSQELLNELNRSLVTTIDLEGILDKSALIISETIKSEYCTFAIKEDGGTTLRLVGTSKNHQGGDSVEVLQKIAHATSHLSTKVVVADELESNKQHIQELMRNASASVFVRLRGKVKGREQHPGYIILGPKRSGGQYTSQDVGILEIIADELIIAIQNSLRFEEIQRFNITLQQKIEEATKELRRVNVRLRELDKTKDEFISMASHQLRTPLTAVKGYLSMILEGDAGKVSKAEKEYAKKAFDGANKMVFLISDMLNVSRLQTGKFVIENKPTDLVQLVAGEVDQLQETANVHSLKLLFHKPDKIPMLNLDETKIRQVVMNFMDNAIYYTPAGGSVTVDLSSSDSGVTFTVTDTGLGVPASVQHHLFSKFYRADNARKMRPDGTGLGLFMAKKVISAQGGAIIFKSTEGKGSTFGFSFPRASTEVKSQAAVNPSAKEATPSNNPKEKPPK